MDHIERKRADFPHQPVTQPRELMPASARRAAIRSKRDDGAQGRRIRIPRKEVEHALLPAALGAAERESLDDTLGTADAVRRADHMSDAKRTMSGNPSSHHLSVISTGALNLRDRSIARTTDTFNAAGEMTARMS